VSAIIALRTTELALASRSANSVFPNTAIILSTLNVDLLALKVIIYHVRLLLTIIVHFTERALKLDEKTYCAPTSAQ